MAKIRRYKVMWKVPINVMGERFDPEAQFDVDSDIFKDNKSELNVLEAHGYIKKLSGERS